MYTDWNTMLVGTFADAASHVASGVAVGVASDVAVGVAFGAAAVAAGSWYSAGPLHSWGCAYVCEQAGETER